MRLRSVLAVVVGVVMGVAVLLAQHRSVKACLHGRRAKPVTQKGQQAVVLFERNREHLVLSVKYETKSADRIALVMPVPTIPFSYGIADSKLFGQMAAWADLRLRFPRSGGGNKRSKRRSSSRSALTLLNPVVVGPYKIQPVRAYGVRGARALRKWLVRNGFVPMPTKALEYYVRRRWTFLAVRVLPSRGKRELAASGDLPALRVSFRSRRIVFPLKLEGGSRFPVRVYVITPKPLSNAALAGAATRGFNVTSALGQRALSPTAPFGGSYGTRQSKFAAKKAPKSLQRLLTAVRWRATGPLHMRILYNPAFGHGTADPNKWAEDLSIPGLKPGQRLLGR